MYLRFRGNVGLLALGGEGGSFAGGVLEGLGAGAGSEEAGEDGLEEGAEDDYGASVGVEIVR